MYGIVGDVMEKYCVTIKKGCISIQKNNNEPIKQEVFVFPWIFAYILQRSCEELPSENFLQENIEEFVFEINNANTYEDLLIPDAIKNILPCLEKAIKTCDTIDITNKISVIHLDQSGLRDVFFEVIDDVIMSYMDGISDAEIILEIDKDFGNVFSKCVFERLQEFDNNVIMGANKASSIECQIYYERKLLFELPKDFYTAETIEIVSEMSEGIPIVIVDASNKAREYRYMNFPFWNIGDEIELTVALNGDKIFLKGRHKKTNIISWLEI